MANNDVPEQKVQIKKVRNKKDKWALVINGQVADTTEATSKEEAAANFGDVEKQPWTPAFVRRKGLLEKS